MTFREYVAIDAHNWSSIKNIEVSPLEYWHAKHVAERVETSFFRVGRATHALVLEPKTFAAEFAKHAKATGKGSRATNALATTLAASKGITLLDDEEWEQAHGCAASVLTNPWAQALLKRGLAEHVVEWVDKETGLRCKARADFAGRSLVDLKTATRIDPRVFTANAIRLGYLGQFAFYDEGLRANGIEPEDDPHMIVVQSEMPHDVIVWRMTPEAMELGRKRVRRSLRILSECLDADYWPGAGAGGPIDFVPPRWAHEAAGWSLTGDGADYSENENAANEGEST